MDKTKRQLRAEAVERVRKAKDAGTSIGYAIVGREYYPWEAYETLIDLLTDEPMDTQRDTNGTCPDDDETCPNDKLAPENDVSANDVDSNDANAAQDTREKLESAAQTAAGYIYCRGFTNGISDAWNDDEVDTAASQIIQLLDRQAAITEREVKQRVDFSLITQTANALFPDYEKRIAALQAEVDTLKRKLEASTSANDDYREEWHRVCEERMNLRRDLTAEKNKAVELAEQLVAAMAERDEWRAKVGAMLDAAQEIRRIADIG